MILPSLFCRLFWEAERSHLPLFGTQNVTSHRGAGGPGSPRGDSLSAPPSPHHPLVLPRPAKPTVPLRTPPSPGVGCPASPEPHHPHSCFRVKIVYLLTKPISAALFLSRCFLASLARPDVAGSGVPGLGPCSPPSVPGDGLCPSSQADVLAPWRSPHACSARPSRRAPRLLSALQLCLCSGR